MAAASGKRSKEQTLGSKIGIHQPKIALSLGPQKKGREEVNKAFMRFEGKKKTRIILDWAGGTAAREDY